jgi:two-component system, NtrC family, response regulator AtoC
VKKKIYIVDDEPKIGNLFVTVLKRDGFDARSFVNPTAFFEALDAEEYAERHPR